MSAVTQAKRAAQFIRHLDRYVLQWIFGFDRWHVNRLADRPYALRVIAYLNELPDDRRGRVVEIGCGLGDILRRLQFRERLGLDDDPSVLRAARVLAGVSRRRPRFAEFTFPHPLDGRYDAIITVNWPHLVDEERLRPQLAAYVNEHLSPAGVLIIDTVRDPAYTHHHDIGRLTPDGSSVTKLGDFERQRELWAIRVGSDPGLQRAFGR
jgi:SAM-dependent methyltransferase